MRASVISYLKATTTIMSNPIRSTVGIPLGKAITTTDAKLVFPRRGRPYVTHLPVTMTMDIEEIQIVQVNKARIVTLIRESAPLPNYHREVFVHAHI